MDEKTKDLFEALVKFNPDDLKQAAEYIFEAKVAVKEFVEYAQNRGQFDDVTGMFLDYIMYLIEEEFEYQTGKSFYDIDICVWSNYEKSSYDCTDTAKVLVDEIDPNEKLSEQFIWFMGQL